MIGKVHYTFLALDGPCSTRLTPYQEVASGFDNEKFNGDYGGGIPPVGSSEPQVEIDKDGNVTVSAGDPINYTIAYNNKSSDSVGLPLNSMPLVFSDTIPADTTFVSAGGAGVTVLYSTDNGATWSSTAPGVPGTVTNIQWWFDDPLAGLASGSLSLNLQASASPASPFVENCVDARLGNGGHFAKDCHITMIQGTGSIGDFVWRDLDGDGIQDGGSETGIDGVTVYLYWDKDGGGTLDSDDVLIDQQDTAGGNGAYDFTQLPAGSFLVQVNKTDASLPTGYRLTTPEVLAVTLSAGQNYDDADFGFGPSLTIEKQMLPSSDTCGGYEGREVVYSISLANQRPGTGETVSGGCRYPIWSSTGSTANPPKNFTDDYYAYGEPDDNYAYGDFSIGSNRWIQGTGFDPGSGSGTIGTVEAVFRLYLGATLPDDSAVGKLYQGATELGTVSFTTAQLNGYVGQANAGYLVWDITSGITPPGGSWSWDDFALLTLHLEPTKSGGADASVIYLDAIGFRVTTSDPCPAIDDNDIMSTVPLTDTYDATYLQFVSTDPPYSTINPTTGVITWTNVGPIYPGEARTVYVRFLAKNIGTSNVTANNKTGVTGAQFVDGGAINDVADTATGSICPTGSINGTVYSDLGTQGWNYVPGTDLPIPGVRVTLYGCYDKTTGDLVTVPAPFTNQNCASSQNNGEWRVRATQVTDASGYYAFNGLLNGFFYVQTTSANLPGTVTQTAEANDNQAATGTLPNTTASGHTCGQPGGTCDSTWGTPTANLITTNFNPINSPGETNNGVNFGYNIQPGAYGSVWEDNNGDGDKDSGEGPIGSVTAWLYANSDCSGAPSQSTPTDANGRYQFGNLTAGNTYCIAVDTSSLPGGAAAWLQTGESDGSINNQITFTAVAGTLSGSHDFGFRSVGSYHRRRHPLHRLERRRHSGQRRRRHRQRHRLALRRRRRRRCHRRRGGCSHRHDHDRRWPGRRPAGLL